MMMMMMFVPLGEANPSVTGKISMTKGKYYETWTFLLLAWTSSETNRRVPGDLRRHDVHVTSLKCSAALQPVP